ncbi:Yip5p SCDLUD_000841 [Saccharomycodes ludwigii]|uniref:Yip5p n=1 Tax=Saccharomycodes ludwigii TaxID=36035 RepID=UPI001E8716DC|nr:hypothetical protein SCDLUD_000841 [Saccharomycodes ludwigii]KAH3903222.1 hypothetical protein SCDLUD_000841 [Saccharomycodes ludwigii]
MSHNKYSKLKTNIDDEEDYNPFEDQLGSEVDHTSGNKYNKIENDLNDDDFLFDDDNDITSKNLDTNVSNTTTPVVLIQPPAISADTSSTTNASGAISGSAKYFNNITTELLKNRIKSTLLLKRNNIFNLEENGVAGGSETVSSNIIELYGPLWISFTVLVLSFIFKTFPDIVPSDNTTTLANFLYTGISIFCYEVLLSFFLSFWKIGDESGSNRFNNWVKLINIVGYSLLCWIPIILIKFIVVNIILQIIGVMHGDGTSVTINRVKFIFNWIIIILGGVYSWGYLNLQLLSNPKYKKLFVVYSLIHVLFVLLMRKYMI